MSNSPESQNKESATPVRIESDHWLRPAFSSSAAALVFAGLIAFALLLPVLIGMTGAITRERSYEIMSEKHGAYAFIGSEIFDKRGDIDVLFIGSSIQWNAVDTPQVQRELSAAIGRPAKVVSFGFNFNGIDVPYVMLRDLLAQRRVRLVVFSIPRLSIVDGPNATAYKFLRFGEYPEVTAPLPVKYKAALYAGTVLRSPHDLLSLLRETRSRPSKLASDLGANKVEVGMGDDPEKFSRFVPPAPVFASDELLLTEATRAEFQFTNEELPKYQEHYLNELVDFLRTQKVPLVVLNVPQYNERSNGRVIERFDFAARFDPSIPLIGVSPARLFNGLSAEEIERLHGDRYHFNANGNEFFTSAVMPALIDVFDRHAAKDF